MKTLCKFRSPYCCLLSDDLAVMMIDVFPTFSSSLVVLIRDTGVAWLSEMARRALVEKVCLFLWLASTGMFAPIREVTCIALSSVVLQTCTLKATGLALTLLSPWYVDELHFYSGCWACFYCKSKSIKMNPRRNLFECPPVFLQKFTWLLALVTAIYQCRISPRLFSQLFFRRSLEMTVAKQIQTGCAVIV